MSSIAVFLILGGASAFAASQLGKNSVGTKQLKAKAVTAAKIKNNAVTGAKVKNGSLTGADINLSTLGTVPSANIANSAKTTESANALSGRTSFSFYMGAGVREIITVAPFTIKASCEIENGGGDRAELQLTTTVNGAAMDDNSGDEIDKFNAGEVAEMIADAVTHGEQGIEANDGDLLAVAPDGTTIASEAQGLGENIGGHSGQCYFFGTIAKVS
jgi:hypothetical protein